MVLPIYAQIILALLIGLFAFLLGRNAALWAALGYLNPLIAAILLLFRHARKPKETPQFFLDWIQARWAKKWSSKLEPNDFKEPPEGEIPKEL